MRPAANRHPNTAQYKPKVGSIESSVLDFVRPSSSTLPLVSAMSSTAFSFHRISAPPATAPPPAPTRRPQPDSLVT